MFNINSINSIKGIKGIKGINGINDYKIILYDIIKLHDYLKIPCNILTELYTILFYCIDEKVIDINLIINILDYMCICNFYNINKIKLLKYKSNLYNFIDIEINIYFNLSKNKRYVETTKLYEMEKKYSFLNIPCTDYTKIKFLSHIIYTMELYEKWTYNRHQWILLCIRNNL
jgi:hypothetical protein